jgi:hypothetical protein
LVLASTSTVLASFGLVGGDLLRRRRFGGRVGRRGAVLDAVLEALDGGAQVGPMFFSFLVPKISTTTSSTISQCQMLKDPMTNLLEEEPAILGEWAWQPGTTARFTP